MKLTPKLLLKASVACVLLTVIDSVLEQFSPLNLPTHRDFALIAAWIVVAVGWLVYLFRK